MQEYTTVKEFYKHVQDILKALQKILDILGENKLIISFDTGTNGEKLDPVTVYKNQSFGILPVPARTGYDFVGWFLNKYTNSLGVEEFSNEINNLSLVTISGQITLYAKWTPSEIRVRLDAGEGGTVQPETIIVKYDDYFRNADWGSGFPKESKGLPTPTRPQRTLSAWYWIENSHEVPVTNDTRLTTTRPQILSAKWNDKKFTLTYNVGTGNGSLPQVKNISENYICSLSTWNQISSIVSNPGYEFLGWSRTPRSRDILQDYKIEIIKNTTVYAIWDHQKYFIDYYDLANNKIGRQSTPLNVPDYLSSIEDLSGSFTNFNHWNSNIPYANYLKLTDGEMIYNLVESPNVIVNLNASSSPVTGKIKTFTYVGQPKLNYVSGEKITMSGVNFSATLDNGTQLADVNNCIRIYPTVAYVGLRSVLVSLRYNTDVAVIEFFVRCE